MLMRRTRMAGVSSKMRCSITLLLADPAGLRTAARSSDRTFMLEEYQYSCFDAIPGQPRVAISLEPGVR